MSWIDPTDILDYAASKGLTGFLKPLVITQDLTSSSIIFDYVVGISIHCAKCDAFVCVASPASTLANAAEWVLPKSVKKTEDILQDFIGEIANIIAGKFRSGMNKKESDYLKFSTPIHLKSYDHIPSYPKKVILKYLIQAQWPIEVSVHWNPRTLVG